MPRAIKALADEIRTGNAAPFAFKSLALTLLQEGGLRSDEQLVHRFEIDMFNPLENNPHPQMRKQEQRFFAADRPGILKQAQRSPNFIVQRAEPIVLKHAASLLLIFNNRGDHVALEAG